MAADKILSIVTCNKNDNYSAFTLERTKFILNYFGFVLQKLELQEAVEYVVVDWGSEETLSSFFVEELSQYRFIKFLNVSPSHTKLFDLKFDTSKALNVGIDNSQGEHVMTISPDQFLPLSVFPNLLNLLKQPSQYGIAGEEYKLIPRKYLEQNFNYLEGDMTKVNNFLASFNHSMKPYHDQKVNVGSGVGAMLLKKEQWRRIGGLRDTHLQNRGQDPVVMRETSKICGHIDTSTFGIFMLKLPRTQSGHRSKQIENTKLTQQQSNNLFRPQAVNPKSLVVIDHSNVSNYQARTMKGEKEIGRTISENFSHNKNISRVIDVTSIAPLFKVDVDPADISATKTITRLIDRERITSVIFDLRQAIRFISFVSRRYRDIKIHVISSENSSFRIGDHVVRDQVLRHSMSGGHYGYVKVLKKSDELYDSLSNLDKHLVVVDGDDESCLANLRRDFDVNSIFVVREKCSVYAPRKNYQYINITENVPDLKVIERATLKLLVAITIALRRIKWSLIKRLKA